MLLYSYLVTSTVQSGGESKAISDSGIIAVITDPASWDSSNSYTGSTTGLKEGNYYNDDTNRFHYQFQDGVLRRYYLFVSTTGQPPVTDQVVIEQITDESHWSPTEGYTGSLEGLTEGNYYYDDNKKLKYEFSGGKLRRFTFNSTQG